MQSDLTNKAGLRPGNDSDDESGTISDLLAQSWGILLRYKFVVLGVLIAGVAAGCNGLTVRFLSTERRRRS